MSPFNKKYNTMKITKYIAMMAAVVGMTAACQKEEVVTFNPENVVAPVLHAVEDIVVTAENKENGSVTFSWDAADFGVKTQIFYSLDMSKGEKTVNLFSGISGDKASVSLDNINNKAFNDLEIPSDEATEVVFTLSAKLNVGASYAAAPVTGKVTPTAAEKVYPKVWVIGNYCGWAHDKSLYLWNFAEDDDVFMGVVDFGAGEEKTGGFKITPAGNWDAEFGGTGTADEEPSSIAVVTSGGSDIKNFTAKRFYHFSLSKSALTLSKNYSFDQVGIIGLNGDWDNDIVMEFNAAAQKQVFYADVEVAAATEFKFRMDGAWDLNFGGDMKALTPNGSNIAIEPGNYRVYLNLNNPDAVTCTLDTRMYGQEEGAGSTTPEPEPEPEPDPTLPEGARAINILCENPGWETANLYGWEAATSFNWPGIAYTGVATLGGAEYFYWTLEAANWGKTPGLIFNNGSVQTVDITGVTLDGDKCFRLTAAGADGKLGYEAVECPVIKITYKNEAGWDAVSMYGWGDLGDFGGWPGAPMTKEGDVWVYELPVEHLGKSTSLIFNNAGAGAQTVDLGPFVLTEDLVFDNSNAAIK